MAHIDAVPLPHPLIEAFGRPTWRELRARRESEELRAVTVPLSPAEPQPIVLVPGFLGSAESLAPLRDWLTDAGHEVVVADLERNVRGSVWAVNRIHDAITSLGRATRKPVVVMGHSRGGQQARIAVQQRPAGVSALVTLGAPFRHHVPRHFVLRVLVEALRASSRLGIYHPADAEADEAYVAELQRPWPGEVPFTSIWSRSDGFVAWQQCLEPAAMNIEVDCSHRGLVASVPAFEAIASALGT